MMKTLDVPKRIEKVWIFADNDEAGRIAAYALAAKLPPVFNGAIDSTDFESIMRVVNLDLLVAASTPKQISRASLAAALLVVNPNLRLSKTGGIVHAIGSPEDLYTFPLTLTC